MDASSWHKVKDIFHRAAELAGDARVRFVDEATAGDVELRDEVIGLLLRDEHDDSRLRAIDAMGRPPGEPVPGALEGTVVASYRILRRIAGGGMGEVYLGARDDGQFERSVAVKFLRAGLNTRELIERFDRERHTLARLDHVHIARLLDGGSAEDARPYLVMEFVDGVPLDRHCDDKRLSVRERLALVRKVCDAVSHAHHMGVIHRDLKPGNILVRSEDGEPRLLDFGIARLMESWSDQEPHTLTVAGERLFTPDYGSPEQIRGERVTPATDVYALGVILYELLAGVRPHASDRPLHELERAVCEQDPPRPSTAVERRTTRRKEAAGSSPDALDPASARDLRREIAGDLDAIVMKCIEKEPRRRYASVDDLDDDLARFLDGRPIRARPSSVSYRARRYAGRHPARVGLCTLAAMMAIGGPIALWRDHRNELERLAAARASIAANVAHAKNLRDSGKIEPSAAVLQDGLAVMQESGLADPVCVDLLVALGVSHARRGELREGEACLDRALAMLSRLDDDPEWRARVLTALSWVRRMLGDPRADDTAVEALTLCRQHLDPDDPDLNDALRENASVYERRGVLWKATELLREAVELQAAAGPSSLLAQTHTELGLLFLRHRQLESAERELRKAYEMFSRFHGQLNPVVMETRCSMARALALLGRFEEADPHFAAVIEYATDERGDVGPEGLLALGCRARLALDSGDCAAATAAYDEFVHWTARWSGVDSEDYVRAVALSAQARWRCGDRDLAERACLGILTSPHLSALSPFDQALVHTTVGLQRLNRGELADAESELLRAYEILRWAYPTSRECQEMLGHLRRLYTEIGRPDEAARYDLKNIPGHQGLRTSEG